MLFFADAWLCRNRRIKHAFSSFDFKQKKKIFPKENCIRVELDDKRYEPKNQTREPNNERFYNACFI